MKNQARSSKSGGGNGTAGKTRSPDSPTPTLSPRRGEKGHPPTPESQSWFGSAWNAMSGTPPRNSHQPPNQSTPTYTHSDLNGDHHYHGLDLPEDTMNGNSNSNTTPFRIQPRSRASTADQDDEEVIYMEKQPNTPLRNRSPMIQSYNASAANHARSLPGSGASTPLRNRSPKMTNRPPMLPSGGAVQSPRHIQQPDLSQPVKSHFRRPYSPVPVPSGEPFSRKVSKPSIENSGSSLRNNLGFLNKQRATLWTVLSILFLGPTVIIGGRFFMGPPPLVGINDEPLVSVGDGILMDNSMMDNAEHDHRSLSMYDTNTFLIQNQMLNAGDGKTVSVNNRIKLKQQRDGNLVLYDNGKALWSNRNNKGTSARTAYVTILQGDGNLITRSMTFDIRAMRWVTDVEWSSGSSKGNGEYLLMLTQDQKGLMIVRRSDSRVIWSTVSGAKVDAPAPVPRPTPRPTSRPVAPPPTPQVVTPKVTPYASQPGITSLNFPFPYTVPKNNDYNIQSGPMVGHTTHSSAKFWVYLGSGTPMQLVYWPKDSSEGKAVSLVPETSKRNAAMKTITGLRANTVYLYEIRIQNKWLAQGHFKTAPSPGQRSSFKYVLASCMDVKSDNHKNQPAWTEVLKKGVDFAMLAGDTIYLNHKDWMRDWTVLYHRIWFRYLQQRAEGHFARFIKQVPTYGTWDNHDYGHDYGDYVQAGKENSLKAWGHLWPNPYQGSSKGAGNYYMFSWGDVDFFVLDCRWYRNWDTGTLFGQPQLDWLEDELKASRATFKILISASDVMEESMSSDLRRIGRIVSRNNIDGVLFNSGDVHRNEYKSQSIDNWPYRVHQFTSSGVAVVWRRNFAIVNVNTAISNPEITVQFHSAVSSSQNTDWQNDRNLVCSRIGGKNRNQESRCTQTIRLSDLRA